MAADVITMRGRIVVVGWEAWAFDTDPYNSDWVPMTGRETAVYWTAQRKTAWTTSGAVECYIQGKTAETSDGSGYTAQYTNMFFTFTGGAAADDDGVTSAMLTQAQPMCRVQIHDDAHPAMSIGAAIQALRVHWVQGTSSQGEMDEHCFRMVYDSTNAAGSAFSRIMSEVGLV